MPPHYASLSALLLHTLTCIDTERIEQAFLIHGASERCIFSTWFFSTPAYNANCMQVGHAETTVGGTHLRMLISTAPGETIHFMGGAPGADGLLWIRDLGIQTGMYLASSSGLTRLHL